MKLSGVPYTFGAVGLLALAGWTHGRSSSGSMARRSRAGALTASERKRLPDYEFAVIEHRGGKKVRKYPIHDYRHAQVALTYVLSPSNRRYREQVAEAVLERYPDLELWWNRQIRKHRKTKTSRRRAA